MNVNPVQNNSQSFGMALRLKDDAAKKIAESFYQLRDPKFARDCFIKHIADPIQQLKTDVIYDGKKVLVLDKNDVIEVLDNNKSPYLPFSDDGKRTMKFHIARNGKPEIYAVPMPKHEFTFALTTGDELKLMAAREIGKDLDIKALKLSEKEFETAQKQNKINETAKYLQDLFG